MWRGEILKANALRNPVVVKVEHICDWPHVPMQADADRVESADCIALISEFVDGQSLKRFAAAYSDEITVSFIVQWLETMFNLLVEMKLRGVAHGDLHAGNILVEDRNYSGPNCGVSVG
jgi:RIO-like serine/threonine protein kinase